MSEQEKESSIWSAIFEEDNPVSNNPQTASESPAPAPTPPSRGIRMPISRYKQQQGFAFTGHPVYNIKWDDIGLGLMKPMGYAPNRTIRIEVREGKWIITGARVSSSILLVLALGAGGAFHFLQNILSQIKNWGELLGAFAVLLPTILNLVIRVRSTELFPFELDFLGYDPESHVLVISTVTEPAGVLAMRIDYSSDPKILKVEEADLMDRLRRAHTGFMLLAGDAKMDEAPPIKQWSLWTLIWLVILGILGYFLYLSKFRWPWGNL
jgi:hypothetical protein